MAEQGSTEVTTRGRAGKRAFPEISSRTWEHPADRAALNALKKIPGFDELLRKFIGSTTERSLRLLHLASAVRVNDRQFPRINVLLQEASACLDAERTPELYIVQYPILNGSIIGVDNPFMTLTSSIVETMSDDELIAVIGHELGHCVSGHALYKTLLAMLLQVSLSYVRIGQLIVLPILLALLEWDRKSELSADRAGLLVCQETGGSYDLLMKLAGGGDTTQLNVGAFFEQAEEYRKDSGFLDQVYKILNLLGQRHPFAVLRLTELKTWVDGGLLPEDPGRRLRAARPGAGRRGRRLPGSGRQLQGRVREGQDDRVGRDRLDQGHAGRAVQAPGDQAGQRRLGDPRVALNGARRRPAPTAPRPPPQRPAYSLLTCSMMTCR